ncbi:lytic murein transglycosylase [Patescibacteria group bacterium]|nr:lytic murein transglycosylase [Patescibacteria group bacterium]MBU1613329.1 lytic murein transglycosylase [Patescibacteria group bacterium]
MLFVVPAILILPGNFALAENITQEQLEQELKEIQQQIDQYSNELAKTQSQKNTLANKINQLKVRQNSLNLQIKQTSLQINQISDQLGVIEADIGDNLQKQQALKYEMIRFLRQMNMEDESILLQLLSANGFTGACDEIKEYRDLARELGSVFKQNKILSIDLLAKQDRLEDQKTEAGKLLEISSMQKAGLTESLGEQNSLLTKTKGVESNYQAILSDSKKRATEIRNRIYDLFNTGKQIDFGQAVDIAKWASGLTGVRPALLLAILTQESNLGKNVGTCNRAGDPEEKSWKVIMKPTRDQEPFEKITKELGLNIDTTAVSCPMRDKNGKQVGWGGAMGPAQFIPSTWMGYKDKVSALSGKSAANPWDIRDAFLASAVKLKSDGANGTDDGDWKAALRYFAGSVNLTFRFYADNVLATAKKYQADIDEL